MESREAGKGPAGAVEVSRAGRNRRLDKLPIIATLVPIAVTGVVITLMFIDTQRSFKEMREDTGKMRGEISETSGGVAVASEEMLKTLAVMSEARAETALSQRETSEALRRLKQVMAEGLAESKINLTKLREAGEGLGRARGDLSKARGALGGEIERLGKILDATETPPAPPPNP